MRFGLFVLTAALAAAFAAPSLADDECLVTYEEFEEHVKHVDLTRCPRGEIAEEKGFCRLTFHGEKVVVYGFEEKDDEHCLVVARSYPVEELWK